MIEEAIRWSEDKRRMLLAAGNAVLLPGISGIVADYVSSPYRDFKRYLLEKTLLEDTCERRLLQELRESRHPLAKQCLEKLAAIELDSFDRHGADGDDLLQLQIQVTFFYHNPANCRRIQCEEACRCGSPLFLMLS